MSYAPLQDAWQACWPQALALWSKFTRLRDPQWCTSKQEAKKAGLAQGFAMIRLHDQSIVINLPLVVENRVQDYALEIMAHEIGHHVYCPADLTDNARMAARMRYALPGKEPLAGFVANLYADMLINDRLQRGANLRMDKVYRALVEPTSNRMWTLYMRVYEILWSIEKGQLAAGPMDDRLEGDAHLGARLIRSYAREWVDGAGRFAALCLPYLLEEDGQAVGQLLRGWRDTEQAGAGGAPVGLAEIEAGEREGALHPALDPELAGLEPGAEQEPAESQGTARSGASGQYREPFEYGEILKSLGMKLDNHEIAARYYKELAAPLLVRFPTRLMPESTEPLPEGLEAWDIGSPLENVDWIESVLISPRVIPGATTMQRVWGTMEGALPEKQALDLDLYVDCSGSMPNPQVTVSYLALAGAIVALSALRTGARVQATLWSGARQFQSTPGFVRDEDQILRILTGYLGDGTAFPIHVLRDTFKNRSPEARPAHILIISDNGVTTMFDRDEQGNSGWDIARMALDKARGGGTMVLNMYYSWKSHHDLARAHQEGWQISTVQSWDELVAFARWFSQIKYSA